MSTDTNPPNDQPRPLPPARPRVRRVPTAEGAPPSPAQPTPERAAAEPHPASTPDAKTYEVGYGKPPVHTRFPKGVSGNPAGRPKGAKGLNTIVRERLT